MSYNAKHKNDHTPKGSSSNIPPGFEWKSMEAAIYAKMRSIELRQKKKRRRTLIALLSIPILAVCIGIFYTLTLEPSNPSIKLVPNTEVEDLELVREEIQFQSDFTDESNQSHQIDASNENDFLSNDEGALRPSSNALGVIAKINPINTEVLETSTARGSNLDQVDTEIEESKPITGSNTMKNGIIGSDSTHFSPNRALTEELIENSESFGSLSALDSTLSDTQKKHIPSVEREFKENAGVRIGFESGVGLWTDVANPGLWANESFTNPDLSYNIQGYFQKALTPSTFIITKLQFQQMNSRLDYQKRITDFNMVLSDTVIQVNRNLITGQIEKIYGDVVITEGERIIIHHNTSNLFNFSLGLGNNWQHKNFQTDVYYGLSINVFSSHFGRIILDDDVVDYNRTQNTIINTLFTLDAHAGARIHYALKPNLFLTSGIQFQQSISNWSQIEAQSLYPLSVGLNFGISYSR